MLGELVIGYLFLGGVGAGTLVVLSALEVAQMLQICGKSKRNSAPSERMHASPRSEYMSQSGRLLAVALQHGGTVLSREARARGWILCAGFLVLACLCLLVDVGRVDRVLNLFLIPSFSALSIGAFALSGALVVAICFAVYVNFEGACLPVLLVTMLSVLGITLGLVTAVYTGVLLSGMASVSLWQTPMLPVIFLASSVSCGIACVFFASSYLCSRSRVAETLKRLVTVDTVLVVTELALVMLWLGGAYIFGFTENTPMFAEMVLAPVSESSCLSAEALLFGDVSVILWGGLVVCGLVAPLLIEHLCVRTEQFNGLAVAASLLLLGAMVLRVCVVDAALYDASQTTSTLYAWSYR